MELHNCTHTDEYSSNFNELGSKNCLCIKMAHKIGDIVG